MTLSLAAAAIFVALVWTLRGPDSALAATAAVVSCGIGALAGWLGSSMFSSTQVMERLGASMIPRMFVPLCIFLVLHETMPTLVAAGLAYYMIAVYLCLLAAETLAAVRQLQRWDSTGGTG